MVQYRTLAKQSSTLSKATFTACSYEEFELNTKTYMMFEMRLRGSTTRNLLNFAVFRGFSDVGPSCPKIIWNQLNYKPLKNRRKEMEVGGQKTWFLYLADKKNYSIAIKFWPPIEVRIYRVISNLEKNWEIYCFFNQCYFNYKFSCF